MYFNYYSSFIFSGNLLIQRGLSSLGKCGFWLCIWAAMPTWNRNCPNRPGGSRFENILDSSKLESEPWGNGSVPVTVQVFRTLKLEPESMIPNREPFYFLIKKIKRFENISDSSELESELWGNWPILVPVQAFRTVKSKSEPTVPNCEPFYFFNKKNLKYCGESGFWILEL